MAGKRSGLGMQCYVAGVDCSGDVGAINAISTPVNQIQVTGIDKYAIERLAGEHDGAISTTNWFNPTGTHPTLSALPLSPLATVLLGTTLGIDGCAMVAKKADYSGQREQAGNFTFGMSLQGSDGAGLYWGNSLTAGIRTDTTATSPATGVDFLAAASFGWQAYLHVFAVTGTSVTVTIQDSADNAAFTNLSGAAFTAVAAPGPGSQALYSASATATVRQYVRVITTGVFSNAQFNVLFVKNDTLRRL